MTRRRFPPSVSSVPVNVTVASSARSDSFNFHRRQRGYTRKGRSVRARLNFTSATRVGGKERDREEEGARGNVAVLLPVHASARAGASVDASRPRR